MHARSAFVLVVATTALPAQARAEAPVGVVVSGGGSMQAPVATSIASLLQQRGREVVTSPLPPEAVDTLGDCFVIEDAGCARAVVEQRATTRSVVYVKLDDRSGRVTMHVYWFEHGQAPVHRTASCDACTSAQLIALADTTITTVVPAPARSASAAPAAEPTAAVTTTAPREREPEPAHHGLAIGAELGEPTSLTVGWFFDRFSINGAIGTGTLAGLGASFHVDGHLEVARLSPRMPLYVGLGARYYHHGYEAMSVDELPDSHYGLRVLGGVALERGPLQFYTELAPGIDVRRTQSCALLEGPNSICPHTQSTPLFVHFVIGVRWFVSH